jgi:hypothetical protein
MVITSVRIRTSSRSKAAIGSMPESDAGQSLITHEARITVLLVIKGERYLFAMLYLVPPRRGIEPLFRAPS